VTPESETMHSQTGKGAQARGYLLLPVRDKRVRTHRKPTKKTRTLLGPDESGMGLAGLRREAPRKYRNSAISRKQGSKSV